ncbi:hypothetical protein Tco_0945823, partial [Tanacetum coccineum]
AAVLTGLAVLIDDVALKELCLAALTDTCPDFVTTVVGTKFLLGFSSIILRTLTFVGSLDHSMDEITRSMAMKD